MQTASTNEEELVQTIILAFFCKYSKNFIVNLTLGPSDDN